MGPRCRRMDRRRPSLLRKSPLADIVVLVVDENNSRGGDIGRITFDHVGRGYVGVIYSDRTRDSFPSRQPSQVELYVNRKRTSHYEEVDADRVPPGLITEKEKNWLREVNSQPSNSGCGLKALMKKHSQMPYSDSRTLRQQYQRLFHRRLAA